MLLICQKNERFQLYLPGSCIRYIIQCCHHLKVQELKIIVLVFSAHKSPSLLLRQEHLSYLWSNFMVYNQQCFLPLVNILKWLACEKRQCTLLFLSEISPRGFLEEANASRQENLRLLMIFTRYLKKRRRRRRINTPSSTNKPDQRKVTLHDNVQRLHESSKLF